MDLIGVFKNATSGGRDGVEVSDGGLFTTPAKASLSRSQSTVLTLAVRCESGYSLNELEISLASYNETIGAFGAGCPWAELSEDGTTFSSSLTLYNIGDVNKLFYVRVTSGTTIGTSKAGIVLEGTFS